MAPILAIGGIHINEIADDQWGAIGRVVREYSEFIDHVVDPDDVGVFGTGLDRWRGPFSRFSAIENNVFNDVFGFVFKRAVVAIGHAIDVQTYSFTAAADDVNAISFD